MRISAVRCARTHELAILHMQAKLLTARRAAAHERSRSRRRFSLAPPRQVDAQRTDDGQRLTSRGEKWLPDFVAEGRQNVIYCIVYVTEGGRL